MGSSKNGASIPLLVEALCPGSPAQDGEAPLETPSSPFLLGLWRKADFQNRVWHFLRQNAHGTHLHLGMGSSDGSPEARDGEEM